MNFPQISSVPWTNSRGWLSEEYFLEKKQKTKTKALSLSFQSLEECVALWIGRSINAFQTKLVDQETVKKVSAGFSG